MKGGMVAWKGGELLDMMERRTCPGDKVGRSKARGLGAELSQHVWEFQQYIQYQTQYF